MKRLAAIVVGLAAASGCRPPETRAPMDLVHAAYLVIAPEDERAYPTSITLNGETRASLVAPAPAEFRFRLDLPQRASLSFALGMTPAPWRDPTASPPGDHARFTVRTGEPIPDTILFQEDVALSRQGEWLERSVDLSAWSGEEVNLIFNATFPSATGDDLRPVLAVFAEPVVHDRAHYGKAPSVVVVRIDALLRDRMSVYGYPVRTTPGLERFAEDAVVFDDALSTPSSTLASLSSLLADAGYATRAVGTRGAPPSERSASDSRRPARARAEQVTDRAIEHLTALGDRELFLFLDYTDVRSDDEPPPPFAAMFGGPGSRTDGKIRYVDKHVERLLREMKRLNLYDPSTIVVVSESAQPAPLLVKFPGNESGGRRSSESVGSSDVAPTIAKIAGAEVPDGFTGDDLRAKALQRAR